MQLSVVWKPVARAVCALTVVLGVCACSKGSAAGDGDSAAAPGAGTADAGGAGAGYVLQTQMRPEAPAKYFAAERGFHEACVALAKGLNLAVKPFPEVPADFVAERHTYASDGRRFTHRDIRYFADTRKMKPESACEVRLASQWRTSVVSDGQVRQAAQDEDGRVEVSEPQPAPDEPVRASLLASRTLAKRINGVPLKCNDDSCIVDPAVVVAAEGTRPIQVAYRDNNVGTYGTALIVEPMSLSVGKPADPALFSLDAAK